MAATDDIEARVKAFIAHWHMLPRGGTMLVGFSGGADSTALLVLLERMMCDLMAVHLHHGLRGRQAAADADWCRQFCDRRGISFECRELQVPARQRAAEGVEEAARRCRLGFWKMRAGPDDVVALGHHADDCLEDMALRLVRGANASGLTGLRPVRRLDGVRTVRPLLCLRRSEIEAFLVKQGITDWREDETNADVALRRNAVRHEWLPLIRRVVGHDRGMLRTLEALRDDADLLETLADEVVAGLSGTRDWRDLHPALLPRVMRLWLREQTGRDVILSHDALQRLRAAFAGPAGTSVQIPCGEGVTLTWDRDGLHMADADAAPWTLLRWNWRETAELPVPGWGILRAEQDLVVPSLSVLERREAGDEWFAPEALPSVLTVRHWCEGDRMVPFGASSARKLQDLFTDMGVPRRLRHRLPVVWSGDEIIWVPGVRRAAIGRVVAGEVAVRLTGRPLVRNTPGD